MTIPSLLANFNIFSMLPMFVPMEKLRSQRISGSSRGHQIGGGGRWLPRGYNPWIWERIRWRNSQNWHHWLGLSSNMIFFLLLLRVVSNLGSYFRKRWSGGKWRWLCSSALLLAGNKTVFFPLELRMATVSCKEILFTLGWWLFFLFTRETGDDWSLYRTRFSF